MFVLIKRTYCEADEGEGQWCEERVARFDTRQLAEDYEKSARNSPPIIMEGFERRYATWTRYRKYRLDSYLGGADSHLVKEEDDVPFNPTVRTAPPAETVAYFTTAELTKEWKRGGEWFHPVAVLADGSRMQTDGMCTLKHIDSLNKQYGLIVPPEGAAA